MKKIILILLTFLIFTSCGYTPIYSTKNFNFNIKEIKKLKDDKLNSTIEKRLNNFSNKEALRQISIEINVEKKIIIISKDSKGDPSNFEMIIKLDLEIIDNKNQKLKSNIQQKFIYSANSNRFALSQYEKEIEELLINKIIEDIIKYLSKI
jgi:hypothetical protein